MKLTKHIFSFSQINSLIVVFSTFCFCTLLLNACKTSEDPQLHHNSESKNNNNSTDSTISIDTPEVEVIKVEAHTLDRELKLPGEILPYQDVPLYPKIPGFIKWIGVDRGYHVKKGQLLVQMIAPEIEAQKHEAEAHRLQTKALIQEAQKKLDSTKALLAEAKAKLNSNRDTYLRLKKAAEIPGVISGNELEVWQQTTEADKAALTARQELVKAAESQVLAAKEDDQAAQKSTDHITELLNYLKITAPYDGMITERNMHEGSFAYPPNGSNGYPPMLRIKQNSLMRIVIPVPEYAVDGVKVGEQINFTVQAFPERIFTGTLARIAHSLDVKTRTEPVELNYWNTDRSIDPGMFPEIIWPMKRSYKTLFVPNTAICESLEKPFVLQIKDGHVHKIIIRRGQSMDNKIEIFGNIQEGDLVATHGTDEYAEGSPIKILNKQN